MEMPLSEREDEKTCHKDTELQAMQTDQHDNLPLTGHKNYLFRHTGHSKDYTVVDQPNTYRL
jgi:hypothetical protein